MNIFATSLDPTESAENLDDKRLIKMILESAQLLSTAINESGGKATYKSTHVNHPCSLWTRKNRKNYLWLLEHFVALCGEYQNRFHKIHKCWLYYDEFCDGQYVIPNQDRMNSHPNCTIFKDKKETYEAYRMYLKHKWNNDKRPPKWTNCLPPSWK